VRAISGEWAFEGAHPFWHADAGVLLWADCLAPAVHLAHVQSDRLLARLDQPIEALLPLGAGAAVLCADGWHRLELDGQLHPLPTLPRRRCTALAPGSDGMLWACMADGERWRVAELAHDGSFVGGWHLAEPASALAYDERSHTLVIAAADSGALYAVRRDHSALRRLATVPKGSGRLGGVAIDGSGGVWAALRGGWSVVRFAADGSMDRVLALPVPNPTAVALGGADGDDLFITSERHALSRESLDAAPLSGRLFVLEHVTGAGVPPAH
jgi:sugar lactone lactonase YvrE